MLDIVHDIVACVPEKLCALKVLGRTAMPGSRQKKKKKTGKKGGGAKAERPETAERTEAQKEKDDAKNWVELEKQELAHMDEKMAHDPNWLAFSLAKAPWLNFSIDKAIDTALDDSYIGGSDEVVAR